MAEPRTEKPTPRHIRKAQAAGDAPRSPFAVAVFASLAVLLVVAYWISKHVLTSFEYLFIEVLRSVRDGVSDPVHILNTSIGLLSWQLVPVWVTAALAVILTSISHTGFAFFPLYRSGSRTSVRPSWWSRQNAHRLAMFALGLLCIYGVLFATLKVNGKVKLRSLGGDPIFMLQGLVEVIWYFLWRIGVLLSGLAILDVLLQRLLFFWRLKMTRRELRDEIRQYHGDPRVRSERKKRHRELSRWLHNSIHCLLWDGENTVVALGEIEQGVPRVLHVARGAEVAWLLQIATARGLSLEYNASLVRQLADVPEGQFVPQRSFDQVAPYFVGSPRSGARP